VNDVRREICQTGNFILYPSRHGAIGDVEVKASRDSWPVGHDMQLATMPFQADNTAGCVITGGVAEMVF
jgi:hypothetical protein